MSDVEAATERVAPAWQPWRPTQPETDRNGVPIVEGCKLRRVASGGILPGYTADGIASYLPGNRDDGLLYIKQVEGGHERFINAWNQDELEVLA